jgi:hypothetical protein
VSRFNLPRKAARLETARLLRKVRGKHKACQIGLF